MASTDRLGVRNNLTCPRNIEGRRRIFGVFDMKKSADTTQLQLSSGRLSKIADKSDCAVVDLFCGIGGITHGFYLEGFSVVAGLDIDGSCRYAYEHNNPGSKFIEANVAEYPHEELSRLYSSDKKVRVMIGCAPCQPFSTNNSKRTRTDNKDDRWKLVGKFAEAVNQIKPDIVSMENVPNLASFDDGRILAFFIDTLMHLGYHVYCDVVACASYGVPQSRKRLVVLASRFGEISLLPGELSPENYRSVRETIFDTEPIEAGQTSVLDPLHKARRLSETNLERIRSSLPGRTWESWDESLQATCHKKVGGSSYKSVYGRMEWDKLGPTITAQFYAYGSGRFGHPEQDRAISLREGALLQTFPPGYEFSEPNAAITFNGVGTHIGNAVPVKLARAIARSIAHHLGCD